MTPADIAAALAPWGPDTPRTRPCPMSVERGGCSLDDWVLCPECSGTGSITDGTDTLATVVAALCERARREAFECAAAIAYVRGAEVDAGHDCSVIELCEPAERFGRIARGEEAAPKDPA